MTCDVCEIERHEVFNWYKEIGSIILSPSFHLYSVHHTILTNTRPKSHFHKLLAE